VDGSFFPNEKMTRPNRGITEFYSVILVDVSFLDASFSKNMRGWFFKNLGKMLGRLISENSFLEKRDGQGWTAHGPSHSEKETSRSVELRVTRISFFDPELSRRMLSVRRGSVRDDYHMTMRETWASLIRDQKHPLFRNVRPQPMPIPEGVGQARAGVAGGAGFGLSQPPGCHKKYNAA
jgi:hypothetical protein